MAIIGHHSPHHGARPTRLSSLAATLCMAVSVLVAMLHAPTPYPYFPIIFPLGVRGDLNCVVGSGVVVSGCPLKDETPVAANLGGFNGTRMQVALHC